ncbi:MAG TPA: hypothetical protein VFQ37_13250 [Mycobacterium sp.]|nr:hypothetical protein [Mycobacterium sp.]
MLIIALVLAVIGLAALVFAVVTSNALVAWVCIGASALGVLLLIIDALRERRHRRAGPVPPADETEPAPEADDTAGATGASETVDEEPTAHDTDQAAADTVGGDDQNAG